MFKMSLIFGVVLAASISGSAFAQSTTQTSHPALTDQQLSEQLVPALGVVAGQLQPLINTGTKAGAQASAQGGQAVSQQAAPQSGGQAASPAAASTPQIDLMGEINQGLRLAASPHS